MTKAFLHGRTEAIRTVQLESIHFVKARPSWLTSPLLRTTQRLLTVMCRVAVSRRSSQKHRRTKRSSRSAALVRGMYNSRRNVRRGSVRTGAMFSTLLPLVNHPVDFLPQTSLRALLSPSS